MKRFKRYIDLILITSIGVIWGINLCIFYMQYTVREKNAYCPQTIEHYIGKRYDHFQVLYRKRHTLKIKTARQTCTYLRRNKNIFDLFQRSQVSYTKPKKIAILYISTGRYIVFWENFYKTMEKFFLPKHEKTYFVFTDHMDIKVADNVRKVETPQKPWPHATFMRYHFFSDIANELEDFDYIYFLNGNLYPKVEIDEEIFPADEQGIMVALQVWSFNSRINSYPYERYRKSIAFIPYNEGKYYVTGAFNGGTAKAFLEMTNRIKEMTDIDIKNNIIPRWHDESMLNRYVLNYMKTKTPLILSPEFTVSEKYRWLDDIAPKAKMMLVEKNKFGGRNFLRSIDKNQ